MPVCPRLRHEQVRSRSPDGAATALMRCRSWTCPGCRPGLARRLAETIEAARPAGKWGWRLWTLTLPGGPARPLPVESWQVQARAWAALRKRLERRYGRLDWVIVREAHKDGTCHAHLLLDRFIPKRQVAAAWRALGGGFVDARWRVGSPARYLGKYLSKGGGKVPKGARRYAARRGLGVTAYNPPAGWAMEALTWRASWGPLPITGYAAWEPVTGHDARAAFAGALRSGITNDHG